MLPVEPESLDVSCESHGILQELECKVIPPVQAMSAGSATLISKSCVLACERPFKPGTLSVTVKFFRLATIPALPVHDEISKQRFYECRVGLTSYIQIARIWSSTISIDLMNRNGHSRSSFDLSHGTAGESIFCFFSDIDISCQFCTTTEVYDVGCDLGITNDSRVLLTWRDSCAITCN